MLLGPPNSLQHRLLPHELVELLRAKPLRLQPALKGLRLEQAVSAAKPLGRSRDHPGVRDDAGALYVITDNLASHKSPPIQEWLETHPRIQRVFIPKGASWLNLQEAWWRLFRREAFAGQSFADHTELG